MRITGPGTWAAGAALLVLAVAAPAATATTFYVDQSTPGASNFGPCTSPAVPCLTISGGIAKVVLNGDVVKILPDPNGFTDTYDENVSIPGSPTLRLEGAGSGDGGTRIAPAVPSTFALEIQGGSAVSDVHVVGGGFATISAGGGSTLDRVLAENAGTAAVRLYGGTVRDSTLSGVTGLQIDGSGSVVRSRIAGTAFGVGPVNPGTPNVGISGSIFSSVIIGSLDSGVGIDQVASGPALAQTLTLRHVTVTGFATRARIATGGALTNELDAVNTTLAGSATSVDLQVGGAGAKASLIAVNRSPARSIAAPGGVLEEISPVNVAPGLTADGHLAAGSPLIDRGVTTGFLAGDARDALDLDGQARPQGSAPDIGADEIPVAPPTVPTQPPPPSPGPAPSAIPDTTAPVLGGLRLPASLRATCPRRRARSKAPRCVAGVTLAFTLSEDATLRLRFVSVPAKKGRRGVTRTATLQAKAGSNRLRFTGRIGKRALPRGRHRLTVTAVDAAGNASNAVVRTVVVR